MNRGKLVNLDLLKDVYKHALSVTKFRLEATGQNTYTASVGYCISHSYQGLVKGDRIHLLHRSFLEHLDLLKIESLQSGNTGEEILNLFIPSKKKEIAQQRKRWRRVLTSTSLSRPLPIANPLTGLSKGEDKCGFIFYVNDPANTETPNNHEWSEYGIRGKYRDSYVFPAS